MFVDIPEGIMVVISHGALKYTRVGVSDLMVQKMHVYF